MKKNLLFLVLFLFSFSVAQAKPLHDFHASITEVRYNPNTRNFEVGIRYFTDDLAAVLSKQQGAKVRIDKSPITEQLIADYTLRRFEIRGRNDNPLMTSYLGFENEGELTWVYLEVPAGNFSLSSFSIRNSVLFDFFEDQVNSVNVFYKDQVATLVFRAQQEGDTQPVLFTQR